MIVAASSAGKNIATGAVKDLPETHDVDSFSEAGLLSGSSDGTPGLLAQIGEYGIMVFPDFTVLISKGAPERNSSFGGMRRIYDGAFDRRIGSKGGSLSWEGKVGCIAAVTPAVFLTDMGVMGERFLYFPLPRASDTDRQLAGYSVLANHGHQPDQRAARAQLVADFFATLELPSEPPPLTESDQDRLVLLADLGSRGRSPVVRDRYRGDAIELTPEAEHPTRLLGALAQLASGMRAVGTPEVDLWPLIAQVAIGGIHPIRKRIIDMSVAGSAHHTTATIAAHCGLPQTTVRRHLEDLVALGLLALVGWNPEQWMASDWLAERWSTLAAGGTATPPHPKGSTQVTKLDPPASTSPPLPLTHPEPRGTQ